MNQSADKSENKHKVRVFCNDISVYIANDALRRPKCTLVATCVLHRGYTYRLRNYKMTSAQSGAELLFLWTLASALLFPTRELATVRVQSKRTIERPRRPIPPCRAGCYWLNPIPRFLPDIECNIKISEGLSRYTEN